jgi:hypothetical protein
MSPSRDINVILILLTKSKEHANIWNIVPHVGIYNIICTVRVLLNSGPNSLEMPSQYPD